MASLKYSVVLFIVHYAIFADAKKACAPEDTSCYTQAARDAHKLVIEGVPGQVDGSDPLLRELITSDTPDLKYTLKNGKLAGLKECIVELVKLYEKKFEFDYNLACPKIIVEGDYDVSGKLSERPIEGNGRAKITLEDYNILIHGKLEMNTAKTGKTHIHVTDFKVKGVTKGKSDFDLQNLFNGDAEKSAAIQKFLAENSKIVDEIASPGLEGFMVEYIGHINAYLKLVPAEALFAI